MGIAKSSRRSRRLLPPIAVLLALLAASPAGAAAKYAFVTSAAGTGQLDTWTVTGLTLTGVAAGDQICQLLADDGGLANPETFVAWLSTSTDDAYCRVLGLSGTRASACLSLAARGAAGLSAGPWLRTDGLPFLPDLDLALSDGVVYYPPSRDESGADVASHLFFHQTNKDGTLIENLSSCGDWDSTAGSVYLSKSTNSTGSWAGTQISGSCSSPRSLLCLEGGGPGDPVSLPAFQARLAFVTSAKGSGDLGSWSQAGGETGIDAGHTICRTLAADAGLPFADSFFAWLSDGSNDAIDNLTVDGAWVRPDGIVVAASKADLTDGRLESTLNVTENGEYVVYSDGLVWTGTDIDGRLDPGGDDCGGWMSPADDGVRGHETESLDTWTSFAGAVICSPQYRLYCFSNAEPHLFAGGFESGDTSRWSSAVPSPP